MSKMLPLESSEFRLKRIAQSLDTCHDISICEIVKVLNKWYRSRKDRRCLLVGDRVTFTKDAVGHHEYGDTGTIVKKKSFEGDFMVKIDGMQGEYLYYTKELILL